MSASIADKRRFEEQLADARGKTISLNANLERIRLALENLVSRSQITKQENAQLAAEIDGLKKNFETQRVQSEAKLRTLRESVGLKERQVIDLTKKLNEITSRTGTLEQRVASNTDIREFERNLEEGQRVVRALQVELDRGLPI